MHSPTLSKFPSATTNFSLISFVVGEKRGGREGEAGRGREMAGEMKGEKGNGEKGGKRVGG